MEVEIQALNQNQTQSIVPCLPHYNIVGHKWVYKLKYNPDGSIQHHKALLVAKGFYQTLGVDFSKTFSLVIKPTIVCIILIIAVTKDWKIQQLDVNNVFLNGKLQEVVFMSQPEGFVDPKNPEYVCKLHKALYRLKQAPCAWLKNYELLYSKGVSNTQRLTRHCFYIVKVVTLFFSLFMWMIFSLLGIMLTQSRDLFTISTSHFHSRTWESYIIFLEQKHFGIHKTLSNLVQICP